MPAADIRARRLIAQLLAPSAARPAVGTVVQDVASHMLAVQAQNHSAGLDALSLRSGADRDAAQEALAGGSILRSWSQRGTHHYLAARDVRWMTLLCSPRVQVASAKRRAGIGLGDADIDVCRTALLDHLAASGGTGTPVTRSAAYGVFAAAGVDPTGNRGPHMLRHFGGEGDIVQGPRSAGEDTFVLHDAVVPDPVDLTGEDALRELGIRYHRSRGPATVKDLAWWSGLTVRDATKATELAVASGSVVAAVTGGGRTVHLADWQQDVTPSELADALDLRAALPAFDEYLLAYTDRSDVITPGVAAQVGPTKNGLFHACLVQDGMVTGRV